MIMIIIIKKQKKQKKEGREAGLVRGSSVARAGIYSVQSAVDRPAEMDDHRSVPP